MSDLNELTSRIDAQFAGFQKGIEEFQAAAKSEYEAREARFHELFVPAAKHVVELVRPRLQVLVEHFKDRVNVKPVVTEHMREVTLKFISPLAHIDLKYRLSHDADIKNLLLDQHLEILPILMKYDPHSGLSVPLDKIDDDKITNWFDDRIVEFVQTVGELNRNQNYLKGHLVTDPVAGVELPKYAAKTTLETGGKTYYFISDETKNEFAKQRGIAGE